MFTRWQPMGNLHSELSRMQDEMNRLFGHNGDRNPTTSASFPALNMWQDDEQFVVEAELPGLDMNDIEILVNGGNQLTLKGERKAPNQSTGTWHRRERGFGEFRRTVELPSMVDAEKVEAVLTNGVLKITLPKPEEAKPRKITVKAE